MRQKETKHISLEQTTPLYHQNGLFYIQIQIQITSMNAVPLYLLSDIFSLGDNQI